MDRWLHACGFTVFSVLFTAALSTAQPQSAQDQPAAEEPADPETTAARALMDSGELAVAAEAFATMASKIPLDADDRGARMMAAVCWLRAGDTFLAAHAFEQVIESGALRTAPSYLNPDGRERQVPEVFGKVRLSVRDEMERAFFGLVMAHRQAGDVAAEARTIARLRAIFPSSRVLLKVLPPAEAALELAAKDPCDDGIGFYWENKIEKALPLLDRTIEFYPETSAAIRARAYKGRICWREKRYDEARALFTGILERIGDVAPESPWARLAAHRVAWLDATGLATTLFEKRGDMKPIAPAEWQRVRDACLVVMEKSPDPMHRAQMNTLLIAAYFFEGQYEEVLRQARVFFRNYSAHTLDTPFILRIAVVHSFAGASHLQRGELDQALASFNTVVRICEALPNLGNSREIAADSYFQILKLLRLRRASPAQIKTAEQDLIDRFPDTGYGQYLRQKR